MSIVCFGEPLLELAGNDLRTMCMGFAGDTFNVATYLGRFNFAPQYITALGDDPYSDEILRFAATESIDTRYVARLPGKLPGLYAIRTDARGERSFYFWRSASAARDFFRAPHIDAALDAMRNASLLYFSLISLSILPLEHRLQLIDIARECAHRGGRIAFDSNFRPQAWPDISAARELIARLLPHVTFALPTLEDEVQLFGPQDAQGVAARLLASGVHEVAVKCGPRGAWVQSRDNTGRWISAQVVDSPLDTTGAGDSFNAAYLAARLRGANTFDAAARGARLAAAVVQHRGAIIPRESMPE
jgi:2-dehydro-3-deoxygluconokinase